MCTAWRPISGTSSCSTLRSGGPWNAVYVCVDDDSSALDVALQARLCLSRHVDPDGGRAEPIDRPGGAAATPGRLRGAPRLRPLRPDTSTRACCWVGPTRSSLAPSTQSTSMSNSGRGRLVTSNPSLVPWEQLPDSLKESNRGPGCAHRGEAGSDRMRRLPPSATGTPISSRSREAEIERLAELEHERWTDARDAGGAAVIARASGAAANAGAAGASGRAPDRTCSRARTRSSGAGAAIRGVASATVARAASPEGRATPSAMTGTQRLTGGPSGACRAAEPFGVRQP